MMMMMMMMGWSFKTLPFILLVLVLFSLASEISVKSCCSFQHLDHCQVFSGDGNPSCTQKTKPGSHNGCDVESGRMKSVPAHITGIRVKFEIDRCLQPKGSNSETSCSEYDSLDFITLNVSFVLGDPRLRGILFQVISSKNLVAPPSCHYVSLNGSLNYSHVIENQSEKKFYFAGFDELFEPNSRYIIFVRALPAPRNEDHDRVGQHDVTIPDCDDLPNSVYLCTLPSAAKWASDITTAVLGDQSSVNVSFTVNNNTKDFTDYEVKVWQLPRNTTVHRRLVLNNEDKWECDSQSCVMHEEFDLNVGHYFVTVQANRQFGSSQACHEDPYRKKRCRIAYSAVFAIEPVPTTILSTELTNSVQDMDNGPTIESWWIVLVSVVTVVTAVIMSVGVPVCIWCIRKHKHHENCSSGSGETTVEQWDWEHRTLILPRIQLPGSAPNSIRDSFSAGDFTECPSVDDTLPSISANHVSGYTHVRLVRPPPDYNQMDTSKMPGIMDSELTDCHSLQSDEPDLSHSDEGYSEVGIQGEWQQQRHPADRQDSGISMMHNLSENPDSIVANSEGSRLPDRRQQSFKDLSGVKYHALPQVSLSEVATKVTTV